MDKKSIFLISSVENDEVFAREAAGAANYSFIHSTDVQSALKQATPNGAFSDDKIYFVDVSTEKNVVDFEKHFLSASGVSSDQVNPNRIHYIGTDSLEKIKYLAKAKLFGHLITRRYGNPKEAGHYYGRVMKSLAIKQQPGVTSTFVTQGSVKILKLNHSTEKRPVIDSIDEFLRTETDFSERTIPVILNSADELLMNAIYDAPTDQSGDQAFKSTTRDTALELSGDRTVELQMGYDGNYVVISVIDRMGTLNKSKLISRLYKSPSFEEYKVDHTVANAVLGLATTFRTGGSLVFFLDPGKKTEVAVFFKQTENYKDFRNQFRFISIHISEKDC